MAYDSAPASVANDGPEIGAEILSLVIEEDDKATMFDIPNGIREPGVAVVDGGFVFLGVQLVIAKAKAIPRFYDVVGRTEGVKHLGIARFALGELKSRRRQAIDLDP